MRLVLRYVAAVGFVLAGLNHFRNPFFYQQIIPPSFPKPGLLVLISGVCEIAGGIGILIPRLRRFAGWGLITLLIAVFPANLYMAAHPDAIPDMHFPQWALYARLPFQAIFIASVWFVAASKRSNGIQLEGGKAS
jgi:uncharacterized membrane protein